MNNKTSSVPSYLTRVRDYIIDSDNWRFCGIFDHKYSPILWVRALWSALWNRSIYTDPPSSYKL